jgi:multiple sugar transport system ATP-binding protein
MSSVKLTNLRKSYGPVEVIHGIDLEVKEGEFVALVGPSGCGKSTLLRIIAGLDHPTGGHIVIDDIEVNDYSPKERNIAMVFQNYALYPHMSVRQNISFNLLLSRVDKQEIDRRVNEAVRMLGLSELLDRKPSQLSGGQRQRVAMGRAIVRDPAVFLFDEPLSNLDAQLRVQMRGEIKLLHDKIRTTAIYVTHDQIEAMTLADRIVVLNHGRIEQQGSPLELYRRPNNIFVAGFIGSPAMNFINGAVRSEGGSVRLASGETLSVQLSPAAAVEKLVVGIRPEHIRLSTAGAGDISGTIRLLEPTGAQTLLTVACASGTLNVVLDGDCDHEVGEAVHLVLPSDALHFFHEETQQRVVSSAVA